MIRIESINNFNFYTIWILKFKNFFINLLCSNKIYQTVMCVCISVCLAACVICLNVKSRRTTKIPKWAPQQVRWNLQTKAQMNEQKDAQKSEMTMMASSYHHYHHCHHNEQRLHYVRRRFVERALKYLPWNKRYATRRETFYPSLFKGITRKRILNHCLPELSLPPSAEINSLWIYQ